jgi:hypothetical protein
MRYLIINYYRRPNGQMDEVVTVAKRTRTRDIQSAAVILDFQTRSVVKCSMDGVVVPKDWQRIRDFYHQHYSQVIEDLEKRYSEARNTD